MDPLHPPGCGPHHSEKQVSHCRLDGHSPPKVKGRPAVSSKNFIVSLFLLVVMLRYLPDRYKLDLAIILEDVNGTIGLA